MSGTIEKKERIISVLNACNLQKYEHDTSHPIFLSIIGEPHKFTDRLSRVIDIDQLVQLIERTIQLTNSLLQDLKSDHHNSKYEKQDRLKYQMVDCFYKKLRASNKHFTHLEWVSDHMGRQQKYTYHVTNWEVERTLGYIFILFGALNNDGKNIIIDEMAHLSFLYEAKRAGTMGAEALPSYLVSPSLISRYCQGFWKLSESCQPSCPQARPAGLE